MSKGTDLLMSSRQETAVGNPGAFLKLHLIVGRLVKTAASY